MEKQKNNKGVIALLIVIIVILAVLCVLFATDTISFNSSKVDNEIENNNDNVVQNDEGKTESVVYTYDGIKGLYRYSTDKKKDEYGNEYQAWYRLYLYENGTFNLTINSPVDCL